MPTVGTVSAVLADCGRYWTDPIEEILAREKAQGCQPRAEAYTRIKAALIEAVDREVACTNT